MSQKNKQSQQPSTDHSLPATAHSSLPAHLPPPYQQPQGPSLNLSDIYYALFRHKWKILLCSLAGIAAAGTFFILQTPVFRSEAKLFIHYVLEGKTVGPVNDDVRMKTPDQRGETIINSEMQILTSLDLAEEVAAAVGPEKILDAPAGIATRTKAAMVIRRNLLVEVPTRSSVVQVAFQHKDPEVVQPVLREVVERYLKMHVAVHQATGMVGDQLTQETDQLRSRLAQTEEELRKARARAGVVSFEDARHAYVEQISRIRDDILRAEADLAQRSAALEALSGQSGNSEEQRAEPASPSPLSTFDLRPATGDAERRAPSSPLASDEADASSEYSRLLARLDFFSRREQELLLQFREDAPLVQNISTQIAEADARRRELEEAYPSLRNANRRTYPLALASSPNSSATLDPVQEAAQLSALQTRINVLNSQLETIRTEAGRLNELESGILELQRKKELEEANYRYFAASLEQSRIDEALGAGRVSNISLIQEPSPPFVAQSKFMKIVAVLALGGIGAGIAWAFAIELYLDRSVRRPTEVQRKTGLPLFLAVPDLRSRKPFGFLGRKKKSDVRHQTSDLTPSTDNSPPSTAHSSPSTGNSALTSDLRPLTSDTAGKQDAFQPYFEALRDRLIGYFENRGFTHRPKLVAITAVGREAGATTLASGLSSCLSETGEGNVLLVDMTTTQGSAQQFYQGNEIQDIEVALNGRSPTQFQDKLCVVSEGSNGERLSRALPRRFTELVPKMRSSDFDYIVFDMPPVSQVSITPRLSGFMDMVLMVVESEKTDADTVKRARDMLAESKSNVGIVLNKTKTYVPRRLAQELLIDS